MSERGSVKDLKRKLRQEVWDLMEKLNVVKFPRPVYGRIPNFIGSEVAASRLRSLECFRVAKVVKVNPDSPQHPVRVSALRDGKIVLMPTPKLKEGFILLDPNHIPTNMVEYASSIRGSFELGEKVDLWSIPKVDLIVVGSVAVNLKGVRIGKGGGYAELEYAILRELNCLSKSTKVVTTVHDVQVLDRELPHEIHDLVVDVIVTPTRIINVDSPPYEKPSGIYWELVTDEILNDIPVLREIKTRLRK